MDQLTKSGYNSVNIPEDVFRFVKARAALENRNIPEVIAEALESYIAPMREIARAYVVKSNE